MAYTYNEVWISYNSTVSTYNGDEYFLPINVSDSINISENLGGEKIYSVFPIEILNISENVVTNCQISGINVFDSVGISEDIYNSGVLGKISVYDLLNISEFVKLERVSYVNVSDQINISDNLTNSGQLTLNVNDSILIAEYIVVENKNLGGIIENDVIVIIDINTMELQSDVYKYDQIIMSETNSLESFRFSPADSRPVGKIRNITPTDGKLAGFF